MNAALALLVALTSASGPRAGSAIRGRIVGSDGNPAVGVRIVARESITEAELAALRDAGKDRGEAGRTVTGPDGRLELHLPPGDYRIELSGKDLADGSFDSRLDPGEIDDVGEVEIPAARPFSGTVIDAGGRPSSGARVTIRSGEEESGLTLTTTALTGPDGKFTATGAGERVDRIEAVAPGSPSHLVFRFGSTSSRPDSFIRLEPGRRVLGQVRRPNGAPAAGALVFASGHATRTQEDGSFSLDGVSKDPGPVVSTDGDLRGSVRLSRGKESVPIAIRLAETTRLSGSIVDAVTRRPVARARVRLRNVERIAYSDGKGRFQLDGLVAGTEFLSADRKDYVASPFRSVELQGTGNRADIALIPGAVFEGRVLDPSRKPVAGVRIDSERGSPAVRSRKDGTFSILADARSVVTLTARARGFAPAVVAGLRAPPGGRRTGILISLAHGVSMSGRVVDGSGKPVGGAKVQYREEIRGRHSSGSGLGHGDPDFVVTGADGRFRLENLPSTTLNLTVTHAPNATKIVSGVRVASSPPIPDIVLSPAAPVEGFVRDDKGNPVAAATVQAHAADADERAETGADGAFRFVTFAAGAQPTIFAYAVGYSLATRSCRAPAAGIVVVLSSDGIVRGTVEDAATETTNPGLLGRLGNSPTELRHGLDDGAGEVRIGRRFLRAPRAARNRCRHRFGPRLPGFERWGHCRRRRRNPGRRDLLAPPGLATGRPRDRRIERSADSRRECLLGLCRQPRPGRFHAMGLRQRDFDRRRRPVRVRRPSAGRKDHAASDRLRARASLARHHDGRRLRGRNSHVIRRPNRRARARFLRASRTGRQRRAHAARGRRVFGGWNDQRRVGKLPVRPSEDRHVPAPGSSRVEPLAAPGGHGRARCAFCHGRPHAHVGSDDHGPRDGALSSPSSRPRGCLRLRTTQLQRNRDARRVRKLRDRRCALGRGKSDGDRARPCKGDRCPDRPKSPRTRPGSRSTSTSRPAARFPEPSPAAAGRSRSSGFRYSRRRPVLRPRAAERRAMPTGGTRSAVFTTATTSFKLSTSEATRAPPPVRGRSPSRETRRSTSICPRFLFPESSSSWARATRSRASSSP